MKTDLFFEMVKKWTVRDYMTPKVKAEVIIDMLVSEFVPDIIDGYFDKTHHEREHNGSVKEDGALLLAKEFPLQGYSYDREKNMYTAHTDITNSPAADYLVKKGRRLLLIELKTDSGSFSDEQLFRMIMAAETDRCGAGSLFEHYSGVLNKTSEYDKYLAQAIHLATQSGMVTPTADYMEIADKKARKECLKTLSQKLSSYHDYSETETVYLTLGDLQERDYRHPDREYIFCYRNDEKNDAGIDKDRGNQGEIRRVFKRLNYKDHTVQVMNGGSDTFLPQKIHMIDLLKYHPSEELRDQWDMVLNILQECSRQIEEQHE